MDRHADTRDTKREKARRGMRVKGRSLLTLQRTIEKKSNAARAKRAAA
jgi:hypothetical protein